VPRNTTTGATTPPAGSWTTTTAGTPATNADFNALRTDIYSIMQTSVFWLTGSSTYDPPSMADGVGATTTVTVTGAVLGDFAVCSFSLSTQGITTTANVTAADTVTVRFQNETGGLIDLLSGTLAVRVLRAGT
jgi:hypothetical protein